MVFPFSFTSKFSKKRAGLAVRSTADPAFQFNFLTIMVSASSGFGGCEKTPISNTGLNSLELGSPDLTVKIDWLQVSTLHSSTDDFKQMLRFLEDMFADQITWHSDKSMYRGRVWDSFGSSVRGIQVCFDFPGQGVVEPGKGWVMLPGSLLSQVSGSDVYDLCCMLQAAWSGVSRRLDVAIDDYAKTFDFKRIYEDARSGNVARIRKTSVEYHVSSRHKDGLEGESVVLGSAQSDKRLTFYNKAIESDGQIDSHRLEIRLRDCKADEVFQHVASMNPTQFIEDGAKYLSSVVIGGVDFLDRSSGDRNLERLPRLVWWSEFCDRISVVGVRLAAKKQVHSMEKKISWLIRDVAPSLAVIKRVLKTSDFMDFMETLMKSGKDRLGTVHEALIKVFKVDWYCDDPLGEFINGIA